MYTNLLTRLTSMPSWHLEAPVWECTMRMSHSYMRQHKSYDSLMKVYKQNQQRSIPKNSQALENNSVT